MNTSQKNFMVPLAFVGMMFFAIGFALGINSFLMPVLERSMEMSASESNLLLAATFVPFLIFGIPATKCIEAIGYKKTMALSFIISRSLSDYSSKQLQQNLLYGFFSPHSSVVPPMQYSKRQ